MEMEQDWSGGGTERGGAATRLTTELLLFELSRLQLPQAGTTRRMLRAY